MNTIPTNGDHDPIAEDRPEPEPTRQEVERASYILGSSIIIYRAADNGSTIEDHQWLTKRENPDYPLDTTRRWIDETPHHDAIAALESANMHLPFSEQKPLASLLIVAGTLYSQSALTLFERS